MVVSAFVQSTRALLAKFGVDAPDIRIHGLTLDSREVNTKLGFLAIKGHERDGRDFIPQAISLGARVILSQTDNQRDHGALEMRGNSVIISLYDLPAMLSSLAAAFYDYPAQKMKTVAVTGTNGKTSVVQLITQLKHHLGSRSAAIGTLGSGIYDDTDMQWTPTPAAVTTPDAIRMQYILAEFEQQDVVHTAFEASSHALVQRRLAQVQTDVAVFTNLSRDHLDYHGSMEEYALAKRLLLQQPGLYAVVLNADDSESQNWAAHTPDNVSCVWTGIRSGNDDSAAPDKPDDRHCFATNADYHQDGCRFTLHSSWGEGSVSLPLLGEFNIRNVLNAIATLLAEGERFTDVVSAVEALKPVAGRMEVFHFDRHANIVVDYAHTPDALTKALEAARKHTPGKIWCIFGCGGDRDKGKRPLMGSAAEQSADHIVITTDNSRSEAPEAIASDIMAGLASPQNAHSEADREKAIRYCLDNASAEDLVLVAGKGHENYQIIGTTTTDYNERAVVARLQREYS
ncbi:UDP-N-acetylmuramoyl-L-alanyl-D-glutamate--2,6-diaminopimelate ligase [Alteromonas halophila]|uniref:UDP-N-acetylmuramyl-tripeptide synthetase n=1 Tax=Alteromonas halophila TaxID=516698 RepID=A0A918JP94_9ALTE|nr:UDP-N-acetylmuramoyl-L-alanyl-D-glutamate--2,6-diaminopimelate ligase [Alteromonas halophila]GGW94253.1 UDP-N-acetylmuramoyl-L-alanyl-D-glutamate--2,6-diaminopimelate ligase [Alteromonas halophila]